MRKPVGEWLEIDINDPDLPIPPKGMTQSFSNNRFVVMVFDGRMTDKGPAKQVLVQKHDDRPILNHWKEMYKIKNELFGEETVAVEYYPKKSDLINDHNIYWMWIFPEGVLPIPIIE